MAKGGGFAIRNSRNSLKREILNMVFFSACTWSTAVEIPVKGKDAVDMMVGRL